MTIAEICLKAWHQYSDGKITQAELQSLMTTLQTNQPSLFAAWRQ